MNQTFKILAIGNSFSEDAIAYLWDIASLNHVQFTLGNLFIGGCDLETHWKNAITPNMEYTYYKNMTGQFIGTPSSLIKGLMDESWDIITLQQASHKSGLKNTYEPYLSHLINFIKKHQPKAKIYWHKTWAYQKDSNHPNFVDYHRDQIFMHESIEKVVQNTVIKHKGIDGIIDTGSIIQAFRGTSFGDTLTRDGFHLSLDLGRYIAGLTWFFKVNPVPIEKVNHLSWISETNIKVIESVFDK
ncbi:MAG TPA: DUF4886 domain-containing protein [Acholeplasmataceae bacterium]|nr:MAG: hypothetical protein A2013_04910 [Tenericutes bacterium GWE2_38_8]HBG32591.1 DUF4886 domain-containing protein [Acholeplasmataceae bacterium]HBY65476.1 DUF4886 domain-containing protein [Acholeplasmataceae bacterium]